MEQIEFPQDFSEFLKLLNEHHVEYLLIGALPWPCMAIPEQLQIWMFGFDTPNLTPELFDDPERIVRMGTAPLRIEIMTQIDGVQFDECRARAETQVVDGNAIPVISLNDLKINKRASGRAKDLDDLENLP